MNIEESVAADKVRMSQSRAAVTRPAQYRRWIIVILVGFDLACISLAGLAATQLRFSFLEATAAPEAFGRDFTFIELTLASFPLWLFAYWGIKLYDLDRLSWGGGEMWRVVQASTTSVFGVVLGAFVLKLAYISRGWLIIWWAVSIALVISARFGVRTFLTWQRRRRRLVERTLVVGDNEEARHLVERLRKETVAGLLPVGYAGGSESATDPDMPRLGSVDDIPTLVEQHEVDTILVASTSVPSDQMVQLLSRLRGLPVQVHVSSGLYQIMTSRVLVRDVAGVPLVTVKPLALSPANLATKRAFDIIVSVLSIVVFAPLWVPVVLIIKLSSRGPALYKQKRIGRDGVPFEMYKFRSMVADADARLHEVAHLNEREGQVFKSSRDPRITRIGRLIRKYSIDELPQVINVLKGEMSLVGPRPPIPSEVDRYEDWHMQRLEAIPGMTGLWQVSGRCDISFDEMVRLDIYYIENWSVRFDFGIILRTVPVVLLGRGAY